MTAPTVDELTADALEVRHGDLFNPPGLTNFLGAVQVDRDPVAVRNINFPPLFGSDVATGKLYLNGEFYEGTGAPVTFTWAPDRVVRTSDFDDLRISTTTVVPFGHAATVVRIDIENRGPARKVELLLRLASRVTNQTLSLRDALPPSEDTERHHDRGRSAAVFRGRDSGAACVQGLRSIRPDDTDTAVDRDGIRAARDLRAGDRWSLAFVLALGVTADDALATYDTLIGDVPTQLDETRDEWNAELAACVTPNNGRYSGSLPLLETDDDALRRLYYTGMLGVVYFKRESPASVVGRTYDTLTPRYWPTITFLWDYSLSSTVHALLDPEVMRTHLSHWMHTDIHTCMGTSWLTGEGVGLWYSVNDYAMVRLMRDYLAWSGDLAWLDDKIETVSGEKRRPVDELTTYARNWRRFESANGLADYGGIGNLLECVSSYVHEVASLNAANVFNLRTAADIHELRGDAELATDLRTEATELVQRLDDLYVEGGGFWAARQPDGTRRDVRHCYDLLTVLYTIADDLPPARLSEMVSFFERELATPTWMRALSNRDLDAPFSARPDHQWNGSYTAWPSEVARGLYAIGEGERAGRWLRSMAATARQGPFGQAHFVEAVVPPHAGGARKVPPELPYISDWACSGGGSWTATIIEGVFGVRAGLDRLDASPQLAGFDPHARLVGLHHQGVAYDVDADGLHRRSD